jgi:hypothetical protein
MTTIKEIKNDSFIWGRKFTVAGYVVRFTVDTDLEAVFTVDGMPFRDDDMPTDVGIKIIFLIVRLWRTWEDKPEGIWCTPERGRLISLYKRFKGLTIK